jgi:hypothetical protein
MACAYCPCGKYRHGRYTAEAVASRRWLRQLTRDVRALTLASFRPAIFDRDRAPLDPSSRGRCTKAATHFITQTCDADAARQSAFDMTVDED